MGMGGKTKGLGLKDKAVLFAAVVLLANTNFRAQMQADVLPFKGILHGNSSCMVSEMWVYARERF